MTTQKQKQKQKQKLAIEAFPKLHPTKMLIAFPELTREELAEALGIEPGTLHKYFAVGKRTARNPSKPVMLWAAALANQFVATGLVPSVPLESLFEY